MGSVRNKRHAGRQQQQHQATKKKKKQQRQDLRLTIALTKTGGAELKRRWKKSSSNDRKGQMSTQGHRDPSSDHPAQLSDTTAADAAAELKAEEEDGTTFSPLQTKDDRTDDVTTHPDQSEASTTIDTDFFVAKEMVPRDRTAKKAVIVTKFRKESNEESEEQEQKDEDYEKLRQDDQTEFDGDGGLLVTCGENVARLYLSKLRLVARERVQSQCVRFGGSWLTPNEFQRESGREAAKDWKKTIRHNGLCLKQLLSDGIFDFSVSPPVCLCVTCAAAAAAARQGRATTNDEMEITARHPSPASEAASASAAAPDKDECLISGLGSAASAATAASRAGDGGKKEKRRRRSKQRSVKEKTKSSAFVLTGDSAMLRSADKSTRKRKSSSSPSDRPIAELPGISETFDGLTAKSDEITAKSDEMTKHPDRMTVLTGQVTSEVDQLATESDPVTMKLDEMAIEATRVSELHSAELVFGRLETPDGDTRYHANAQGPDLIPKKRRKKSKKNFSQVEKTETQAANDQDFAKAASHSATDLKIPDDLLSSKENHAFQVLAGQAVKNQVKEVDGCNVQTSLCFQVLSICGEVQKQTFELDENQQVAARKYGKAADDNNVYEEELSKEDPVIRNSSELDFNEIATSSGESPPCVNSSEDDYKNRDFRSPSQSVLLNTKNADPKLEMEDQTRETKEQLDITDIPYGTFSSSDAVCSQQPATDGSPPDKSGIGNVLRESIHNIPTMPLGAEGGPEIKSCFTTDVPSDRPLPVAESPPVTSCSGVQPGGTSTSSSEQSTGTTKVSEAASGGVPANATSSRNPHLVAVIAELKQKKQLALTSGAKKQKEAKQSVFNSDQSKGTGVSSNANEADLSLDVASRFLADVASPRFSCSPPPVDSTPPVSSTSGAGQTLQQSSGSTADLTRSMIGVISKAAEGQSGPSVTKHKTKATSASSGRSESNRKRSCRPSTVEGKASKALDGGKHGTIGKDFNPSIPPLSLPSGLYGLSTSQLASLPFPASPYSLFPPYLFMGFPLQPLLPSCPSSDGKLPSFGMAPTLAAASAASDQPPAQAPPSASRKRRSNQSGKSPSQKSRRGSQPTTSGAAAGTNPLAVTGVSSEKTLPATSDLLNSMMAFDLLRSRIGLFPPAGPGLDSPKSTPFYFPWLKPDPSKADVLFGSGGGGGASSSSLLHTMTSDAKLQQAATRTLAAPTWSEALSRPHEQHPKRPKTGDFRPYDPMYCFVDKKVPPTPSVLTAFGTDFKTSRQRDKASLSSTDQKPFSLAASEHSSKKNPSLPGSHLYDDVGALDLSLK